MNYGYDILGRMISRSVSGTSASSGGYAETATFRFDLYNASAVNDKCYGLASEESNGGFSRSYHYNAKCQLVETKTVINGQAYRVKTQGISGVRVN